MDPRILLFIIKLVSSGIVSFLAILLMSKIRELAWSIMTCGFLLSYAAMIFELLTELGIISFSEISFFEIPISRLICVLLPSICYIIAFIMLIAKHN
ncbi:MAG: hypothetical protein K5786_06505 [Treponema sp.]|nr:hypothetical protein [Treponema sp.]